jgi:hypothetical protein
MKPNMNILWHSVIDGQAILLIYPDISHCDVMLNFQMMLQLSFQLCYNTIASYQYFFTSLINFVILRFRRQFHCLEAKAEEYVKHKRQYENLRVLNTTGFSTYCSPLPPPPYVQYIEGTVSYALFISLLISKLFCTMGEGRESPPTLPLPPLPELSEFTMSWWGHTTCSTQYRIYNRAATKLMYIKLPMYLFLIWRLVLMILMGANPLLVPLEGVGPENLDFFWAQMALVILLYHLCATQFVGYEEGLLQSY